MHTHTHTLSLSLSHIQITHTHTHACTHVHARTLHLSHTHYTPTPLFLSHAHTYACTHTRTPTEPCHIPDAHAYEDLKLSILANGFRSLVNLLQQVAEEPVASLRHFGDGTHAAVVQGIGKVLPQAICRNRNSSRSPCTTNLCVFSPDL